MTTILLPWPSRELSPNSRVHWSKKAKAAKYARLYAFVRTKESKRAVPATGKITLSIEFVKPSRRRMDLDNMLASLKPHIDGIAQGLGVDDSRFRYLLDVAEEPVKGGVVRVSIQGAL